MTRILICGSRDFQDAPKLYAFMDRLCRDRLIVHEHLTVIHGDAPGADRIGGAWGESVGATVEAYPADWTDLTKPDALVKKRMDGTLFDAMAGPRRNQSMLDKGKPDFVVQAEGSKGTKDMIRRAKKAGLEIVEVK